MNWKPIVSIVLILTLSTFILHDILPFHNHGEHHLCNHGHEDSHDTKVSHEEHCESHTHTSCIICATDHEITFNEVRIKVEQSHVDVCQILKLKHHIEPQKVCNHLFQNDKAHFLKSKFEQQPHSLRAPPFIV